MMKKFLTYFVWVLFTLVCTLSLENLSAQELKVVSFEPLPADVVARSQVKYDNNQEPCALLRVVLPAEGVEIRGNMSRVGDVMNPRPSEYAVYLPAGTKIIFVNCPGYMPLTYDIGYKLEGKKTYRLTLERPQLPAGPVKPQIRTQWVKFEISTPGATVLIDGMPQSVANGLCEAKFELGTHTYYVSAPQHYPEEGQFTLAASARTDLKVALKPNYGYLDVKSTPSGARVLINGEERGTTPSKIKLGSGTYAVQLIHSGYFVFDRNITITAGGTLPLNAVLKANFAQITLKAPHAHSEIWVNDQFKAKGEWSGRLDANTYLVETRTEGYETVSENVEVVAGVPRTVTLQKPNPIYGLVEITSNPTNASIKLDGQVVGTTPWQSNEVLVGKHTLEISKEEYNLYTQTFTLTQEDPATIEAVLDNRPTYQVGDYYNENGKEGVVFWVDATGKHGKIVSMKESRDALQWASDDAEQRRLIGANSETDGAKNMAVVKRIPNWQSKYPAFKWCTALGEGWYLPAIEELKIFTLDKKVYNAVNRALAQHGGKQLAKKGDSHWYWSSTECNKKFENEFCAWGVLMRRGVTYNYNKYSYDSVRAVSAF